ncbi:MAG: DUF3109 family protein [Ignavibacteriae bacterium]|nr:DUF3109 family protein [Ignavibacteriota bacterium]
MFVIGETVIEDHIGNERFACDVIKCKGACCTMPGGRGAPLEDNELEELARASPFAKRYLSEQHRKVIERSGLYEGSSGNHATTCVDNRACVFVYYEKGFARCSLEKAYLDGKTSWRKPLSCHLFPIRVSDDGMMLLRFRSIPECVPALQRGREENMPLYEFLKDSLIRKFGDEWYDEFRNECQRRNQVLYDK